LSVNLKIMIQRVQSIFLLLATVLMSFLVILPYAELNLYDGQTLTFFSHVIRTSTYQEVSSLYQNTFPIIALILLACLLSFGNIFLFNYRIWQLRICLINMVILILLLAVMFLYYSIARFSLYLTAHAFKFPAIFPFVALLLNFLAYRNIHNDEILVNSYKRIR